MQMSKASDMIKNPQVLRKLLSAKYSFNPEDYYICLSELLIHNKASTFHSKFTDVMLMCDPIDFLKRPYIFEESIVRIPKLTEYYKTYQMFFCRPILNSMLKAHFLKKHFERKAEVFYMNNYYSRNDAIESLERNAYLDEESSSTHSINNTNTIFNSKIREKLNNVAILSSPICNNIISSYINNDSNKNPNSYENNILLSTISFEPNNNTLSNMNDLYSKRSIGESLDNIVVCFNKNPYPFIKEINGLEKKKKIIKQVIPKDNEKCQEKEIPKDKMSHPFYKPYLQNYRSNLADFTQNKPNIVSSKPNWKKTSVIASSRNINHNISSILKKTNRSNKTFDQKYADKARLSKSKNKENSNTNHIYPPNQHHHQNNNLKQTRNSVNSSANVSCLNNINNITQKTMNMNNLKSKGINQKFSLSSCNSLTLIRPKSKISLSKQKSLILPFNINEQEHPSRNKTNNHHVPSLLFKNMTLLQTKAHIQVSRSQHTMIKNTKSVDEKDSKRSFVQQNLKYSLREISKVKKLTNPLSAKLSKQINDILKNPKAIKTVSNKMNKK